MIGAAITLLEEEHFHHLNLTTQFLDAYIVQLKKLMGIYYYYFLFSFLFFGFFVILFFIGEEDEEEDDGEEEEEGDEEGYDNEGESGSEMSDDDSIIGRF